MKLSSRSAFSLDSRRFKLMLVLGTTTCAVLDPTARDVETETRSITVDYRDLDMTRADNVAALKHRIHRAAEQVCGDSGLLRDRLATPFINCVDHATEKAMAAVRARAG